MLRKISGLLCAVKDKYDATALPVKAGLWFTLCGFMQKGVSLITTPFFTRLLDEEQYGIVSIYSSWQVVVTLLVTLTLYRSLMNLYVKYGDKEKVLSAICGLSLLITCVWAVIGIVFSSWLSVIMKLSRPLVISLFIYPIGEAVIQCWMVYKRYIYSYKAVIGVTMLLAAFTNFVGVVAVAFFSDTADSKIWPQTFIYILTGIVLYISIFMKNKNIYDRQMWGFSLTFCIGLMPHYLSEYILQSSDKIMINYMCGQRDVAVYSIAYAVGSLINLFSSAVNSSFAPYQYQQIEAGNYKELSKTANKVLFGLGVVLCLLMLSSKVIVLIFGGEKYLESVECIIPICIGVYFNYLFQLFARAQEYFNRKITIVIPSILCAVLNVVLNFCFIPLYGYKAAAYTTFFCFAVFCLIHYWFYKRVIKQETGGQDFYNGKIILLISIGITVAGALIYQLIQ